MKRSAEYLAFIAQKNAKVAVRVIESEKIARADIDTCPKPQGIEPWPSLEAFYAHLRKSVS